MSDSPPSSKPTSSREDAIAVVRRLRDAGHVAYFAGGCVRDALLGLTPSDYDVATDAPPDRVRELFRRTQAVGAAFGVVLVREGASQVEVATFRSDGKYLDGRHPERVTFADAEQDAKRRDFTINGLFYDPLENRVIDFVGGQDDLKNRVLRAIGNPDERFAEDHLRLLRAARFDARFELSIDPATRAAIARHAYELKRISPERIAEELRRILTPESRARAWSFLRAFELDTVIFRFIPLKQPNGKPDVGLRGPTQVFDRIGDERPIDFGLALATTALVYTAGGFTSQDEWKSVLEPQTVRQMVRGAREALRISNDETETMQGTLDGVALLVFNPEPGVAMLKRFLARPTAALSRELYAALPDVMAPNRSAVRTHLSQLEKEDFAPPPLITGDDLTASGLPPSRAFKRALDETYDAQLEGRVTTKDQALQLGLKIAKGVSPTSDAE